VAAGVLTLLWPARPVYASGHNPFGSWTFSQAFPGMHEYATYAYNALGPIAWLVIGAVIAEYVLMTIIDLVKQAVRREAEEDE
jgi:hypothetical protein